MLKVNYCKTFLPIGLRYCRLSNDFYPPDDFLWCSAGVCRAGALQHQNTVSLKGKDLLDKLPIFDHWSNYSVLRNTVRCKSPQLCSEPTVSLFVTPLPSEKSFSHHWPRRLGHQPWQPESNTQLIQAYDEHLFIHLVLSFPFVLLHVNRVS